MSVLLFRVAWASRSSAGVRPYGLIYESLSDKQQVILAFTLMVLASISVAKSEKRQISELRNPTWLVRTSCLTEIRGGKKSCRGIVIEFDDAQFKPRISPQQLKIFEAKHGNSLLRLMTWQVSGGGRRLTIKFRPGAGDFGTGNRAEITLYKTAFIVPPKDFPDYSIFVQETDLNGILKSCRTSAWSGLTVSSFYSQFAWVSRSSAAMDGSRILWSV